MQPTHRVKFNFKELNLIPPLCSLTLSGGGGSTLLHQATAPTSCPEGKPPAPQARPFCPTRRPLGGFLKSPQPVSPHEPAHRLLGCSQFF